MKQLLAIFCAILWAGTALAQGGPPPGGPVLQIVPPIEREQIAVPVEAPIAAATAAERDAHGEVQEQWLRAFGQTWVRNITHPTLYPYAPPAGRANGKAVIIVPGGGYSFVSIESEGFRLAERLSAEGYMAFVLKYRPQQTPSDIDEFKRVLSANFRKLGREPLSDHPPAVDDLAAAIGLVHADAQKWGFEPDALGVIGFSAGARTAIRLLENHHEPATSLDHVALIYPPTETAVQEGPRPDLFLAISVDDPLFRKGKLALVSAWLEESEAVEAHLYSGGSHGFGMFPRGTTSDLWASQYLAWLALQ